MERFGLVGLPNAGKSSLFNALTGGDAPATRYAFSTQGSNVGVAKVPDHRLDALAEMSKSRKVVQASVEVVDIGGLVAGASRGEGLGNRFLAGIREVDAIVYVLRSFVDDDVPGSTDALEQLQVLELELALADLESVEGQVAKRQKAAKADKALAGEAAALGAAARTLSDGTPLYRGGLDPATRELLRPYFLLTNKPVLVVVNVSESEVATNGDTEAALRSELTSGGVDVEVLSVSAQLEAEAAQLDEAERTEMVAALGLGEGALPRMVRSAYHLLGLRTFLTTGDKESRAWTFRAGAKAPECAGRIHSDLQRGFIRAEVIHWDELLEIGSWAKAKELGKLRVEGKDYEVVDGDVLEIRFNV
jgi:GTP-binding protein YchF